MREAVAHHAQALGIGRLGARAPEHAEEVDALLGAAADEGAREVVFVRYHVARVHLSASLSIFELLSIDPRSRELLFGASATSTHRQDPWPFDDQRAILHHTMRSALDALFRDLLASRAEGHRRRTRVDDVARYVVDRPLARIDRGRVVGTRWSLEHVEGWELTGQLGSAIAGIRAPDGAAISVVLEPTFQRPREYAESNLATLREVAAVTGHRECSVDGRPALEIETRFHNGTTTIQRITSEGGLGIVISCVGTETTLDAHRAECARVLDSVRLSTGE
ncbi:hypothetical protein [Sandaracinus amylolyticus]|uniref:Uncharacterized protein n=1 Tax=Sandaracinus amylolyticus TaxID=927083 RepID=A0A0F6SH56_9BACT|nr:hypothetical protein [Sandaracinus amylolyticus]AKF09859.1 hypothetical protein DB32_007008 [Sandaracinus amylolyticus]